MVVVEMDMHAGENLPLIVVLDMSQLSRQIAHMMVVHERDCPDRLLVLIPLLPDQVVTNQIP